jgi:hypothetical protein
MTAIFGFALARYYCMRELERIPNRGASALTCKTRREA